MDEGEYDNNVSRNVKSQMGHLLERVRQNPEQYDEVEFAEDGDLSDQDDLQYYENYDYADFPAKGKWEVSYNDHTHVKNLAPFPVRVSIDHGSDAMEQWHIPYDNKNYILSMLAGSGISKTWTEGLIDPERANERHGNLRNPYDYVPQKDEVVRTAYRERRPRHDSYRFDRVERNVHDYETRSQPGDELIPPHPRDQRRRSTHIYRYGDVERNVHDYADQEYSRLPPQYGTSAQDQRTRYDAINKWRHAVQTSDHDYNENLESHYNQHGVEASAHDYEENRVIRPPGVRKQIVPMSFVNIRRQYGSNEDRLLKQPMSFVNIRREHESDEGRHFKQIAEGYKDHFHENVLRHKDLYDKERRPRRDSYRFDQVERNVHDYEIRSQAGDELIPPHPRDQVAEGYKSHSYECIPAPGGLYEDIIEEHRNHPYDYGTTHEDFYEQYDEDDDNQTWVTAREKYAQVHHRSQ